MKPRRWLAGVGLALIGLAGMAAPGPAGQAQKVAVTVFEENVGRFSTESFLKSMVADYLTTKGHSVLETYDIPLKSIRMERVYFLDKNGDKVFRMANLSAGLSAAGMKLNTEYQENLIPVVNYEDIVWELDYDKAIQQARAGGAALLVAAKATTEEISVQTQMNAAGMRSVSGRLHLRLIDVATKQVLLSHSDSLNMMGGSPETAGLDAIKALGRKAVARLGQKLRP